MPENKLSQTLQQLEYKSGSILIAIPDEEGIRLNYQQSVAEGKKNEFPYWARIWPSAWAMTEYLDEHPELFNQKKVIEFAAGLALPSLLAANEAESVIASDYLEEPVDSINKSILANRFTNMKAALYNWRDGLPDWEADLVLLSDTNYDTEDQAAVERLIRYYLNQGSTVLLTTPHRLAARELLQSLHEFCRHTEIRTVKGTDISVYKYSL